MQLTLDQNMLIYQRAIDKACTGEDEAWWSEMMESEAVIAAPSAAAATEVNEWWNRVWKDCREMRWHRSAGHITGAFLGADGGSDEVELMLVF